SKQWLLRNKDMANGLMSGNYNYDPDESYINPDQAKQQNDYAKAMLYGTGQQPVKHWTQGVSNMVNALMGGRALYGVGERQRQFDLAKSREGLTVGGDTTDAGGGENSQPGPTQGAEQPPQGATGMPARMASLGPTNLPGLMGGPTATPSSENAQYAAALKNKP